MHITSVCRAMAWCRVIAVSVALAVPTAASAQVQLVPVVSGLASPVFVGHADDGLNRLFIVEQAGIIKVLPAGETSPMIFLDIRTRILAGGERGLLGLAFHPQYLSNGRFFVFYTRAGDGALVVAEYAASPPSSNTAGTTEEVLLTIPHPGFSNHNGGMLAFGPDGLLYIGVGDGGGANDPNDNAQNVNTLLGKILRIDVNSGTTYTAPVDNPFAGPIPGLDEIFAYGMRNPWRFSFDRETGHLWVGDVGQGAREEVDTPIVNGGNYGWPFFEGNLCTTKGANANQCANQQAYLFPLFDYEHLNGRCSLTGGYVYRGLQNAVSPGSYLYGDYCSGEIFRRSGGTSSLLIDTGMLISSFGEDEAGEVYVVDLNGSVGRIAATPPPTCTFSVSPARANYPASGGNGTITVTAPSGCVWTATSNSSWIAITGATGVGTGTVTYSVAQYVGKPKKRTGTMAVAGQTVTIQQSR
jgi:hypothetical protein